MFYIVALVNYTLIIYGTNGILYRLPPGTFWMVPSINYAPNYLL